MTVLLFIALDWMLFVCIVGCFDYWLLISLLGGFAFRLFVFGYGGLCYVLTSCNSIVSMYYLYFSGELLLPLIEIDCYEFDLFWFGCLTVF